MSLHRTGWEDFLCRMKWAGWREEARSLWRQRWALLALLVSAMLGTGVFQACSNPWIW